MSSVGYSFKINYVLKLLVTKRSIIRKTNASKWD